MGGIKEVDRDAPARQLYRLGPGEGDKRRVIDSVETIKATPAQTGGLFGLIESKERFGGGPPLHVHQNEDEAYYVLEGEITFFVGDAVIPASPGTWVYTPRLIPHTWRVESSEARVLQLIVPGARVSFFTETFGPETEELRPDEAPAIEVISQAAARYGVTVLGPPPGAV